MSKPQTSGLGLFKELTAEIGVRYEEGPEMVVQLILLDSLGTPVVQNLYFQLLIKLLILTLNLTLVRL